MYNRRCADLQIVQDFEWAGGVLLEGPGGCGKTTTGQQRSTSEVRLDESPQTAVLAEQQPRTVLGAHVLGWSTNGSLLLPSGMPHAT